MHHDICMPDCGCSYTYQIGRLHWLNTANSSMNLYLGLLHKISQDAEMAASISFLFLEMHFPLLERPA